MSKENESKPIGDSKSSELIGLDRDMYQYDSLWNPSIGSFEKPSNEFRINIILEQYKAYIDTAEATSQRRLQTNAFFLTLTTAVLAALSYTLSNESSKVASCIIVIGGGLGVGITIVWSSLLHSYRRINSGKFKVISWLEQQLPASPMWNAEWQLIRPGNERAGFQYKPLTEIEALIPKMVAGAFLLIIALGIYLLFSSPTSAGPKKFELMPIRIIENTAISDLDAGGSAEPNPVSMDGGEARTATDR